jgi:predicted GNAT superfamily acetyltransferase
VSLRIRAASPEDSAAILAINRAGLPGVTPFAPGEVERCVERATLFWVAELEGEVAGYLLVFADGFADVGDEYRWFSARHARFFYVDSIAVADAHRRSGVGRAFYADLEREARRRAVPRIVCEVNLDPPNPRSLAFHAAQSFREVGRLRVADGRFVALLELEVGARALEE